MRLWLRFATLLLAIILLIFISINTFCKDSLITIQKFQGKIPNRIVSFGDSYSNNPPLQFPLPAGISEPLSNLDPVPPSNSRIYDRLRRKRDTTTGTPPLAKSPSSSDTVVRPRPQSLNPNWQPPSDYNSRTPETHLIVDPTTKRITNPPPHLINHPPIEGNPYDFDGELPGEAPVEELPKIALSPTWTSLLCHEEFACDGHHNFASVERVGVDKSVYVNNITDQDGGADLKEQVARWIEFEEDNDNKQSTGSQFNSWWTWPWKGILKREKAKQAETLFTVWFGISDIMKFSVLSRGDGAAAVAASQNTLFEQLTIISEHTPTTKIFLPYAIDVSLLPAYTPLMAGGTPDFTVAAEIQKNAIFLTGLWNMELEARAKTWEKGQLVLWDVNEWFLSEIRAGKEVVKMTSGPVKDDVAGVEENVEMEAGGWKEMKEACVGHKRGRWELCDDPEGHLMWDEFRLGPTAHKRIAKQAMHLVKQTWPTMQSHLHEPKANDWVDKWAWQGERPFAP